MYDKFILYNIPESLKTGPAQGMFHLQYGENVFSFKCKALVIGLPDGGGGGGLVPGLMRGNTGT